jgi:hypothetical protein
VYHEVGVRRGWRERDAEAAIVEWHASPDVSLAATAGHAHGVRDGRIVLCIHSPNEELDPADVKRRAHLFSAFEPVPPTWIPVNAEDST